MTIIRNLVGWLCDCWLVISPGVRSTSVGNCPVSAAVPLRCASPSPPAHDTLSTAPRMLPHEPGCPQLYPTCRRRMRNDRRTCSLIQKAGFHIEGGP